MKIFNVEDGVKKVYVQKNDLGLMTRSIEKIPASVFMKFMFGANDISSDNDLDDDDEIGVVIIDDRNRMDFVEFSEPDAIKFFEDQDWIIDYKEYRYLSEEELKRRMEELFNELNAIAEKYNAMSEEEKQKNQDLVRRHELLEYKFHTIPIVSWIQKGQMQIDFPTVPDSDGWKFSNDDIEYKMQGSLDPNRVLLFRKDGKPLSKDEKVPNGFLQMGISISLMERQDKNLFMGDIDVKRSFSEDHKYFITDYRVTEPVKDQEELPEKGETPEAPSTPETPNAPVKETGLRRLLNRIFGKK